MSDPLIESIIALAREIWPEAYFDDWKVKRREYLCSEHGKYWVVFVGVKDRCFRYMTTSVAAEPTLAALRDKLQEMKDSQP